MGLIIVAPDTFKGSLPAGRVAEIVADHLRSADPSSTVVELPMADGGEGTVDVALAAGMDAVPVTVTGPLGTTVQACYARKDTTAVLELASAAGLTLLPAQPDRHTAAVASTRGVGELMARAIRHGARELVIGLGGSATTDGGLGLVQALGARVTSRSDRPSSSGGLGLAGVVSIDLGPMVEFLADVSVTLATDVDNPLIGPDGAAAIYGPQKGADADLVRRLDRGLDHWGDVLRLATGVDVRHRPGAGAAGGAGAPLLAAGSATARPGIEVAMELTGFTDRVRDANLVVVGEGSLDRQSLRGKGPVGAARLAQAGGARVVAVVGSCQLSGPELAEAGIDRVYTLSDIEPDLARSMAKAEPILHQVAARLAADLVPVD